MCKNHTIFETKMNKIDPQFMTTMAKKRHALSLGLHIGCIKKFPPPLPPTGYNRNKRKFIDVNKTSDTAHRRLYYKGRRFWLGLGRNSLNFCTIFIKTLQSSILFVSLVYRGIILPVCRLFHEQVFFIQRQKRKIYLKQKPPIFELFLRHWNRRQMT